MKLQYQLNIAFTTLVIAILTITGFIIYSLILNLLIQDEQRQLEQKGELLVTILTERYDSRQSPGTLYDFLEEQDLQLILYNRQQNQVLFSTMPKEVVQSFSMNHNFSNDEDLWELGSDKYVTSRILIYPSNLGLELILLTPLTDLKVVQRYYVNILIIVFIIGALLAILLSSFFTNKLVTPLSRLKTQLKKIEKRQFDEVERIKATGEIKEVEQSVFEMARELERYMKSQQTFFQNASHELKTPLMTIQGYAEGIRDKVFDQEEREKGLEIIVKEINRLKKIINEMILLAKLDSEEASYNEENVHVSTLVDQIIGQTLPMSSERNVELLTHIAPDVVIKVNKEKMLRSLLNIVINGIRHAHTTVLISAQQSKDQVIITVEDDGEGISEALRPHIFHRFVKGKDGQTGLGLAIARAIVEQFGGTIAVGQSDALGGAQFIITFPQSS